MKSINFKEQRRQLLEEIRHTDPGPIAIKKLTHLRQEYDLAIDGYQNSLKILSDTTYEDRRHFLLELIQNADDAQYDGSRIELAFSINELSLELRYNECGFSVDDVIAITDTGESTKAGKVRDANSFIGEKGIGFKSVFALAEEVEIESGPWHFILDKKTVVVPRVVKQNYSTQKGTRLKIFFKEAGTLDLIAEELCRFIEGEVESFLFLQQISVVQFEDQRTSPTKKRSIEIIPSDRQGELLTLVTCHHQSRRKYCLFSEDLEFPAVLVQERWDSFGRSIGNLQRKLTVAALLDNTLSRGESGRLFCYLPTAVILPIPIFLQVDGHLKADREKLHDPNTNSWNQHLLKNLPAFLLRAILSWRDHSDIAENLINYIPDNEGSDQLKNVFGQLIKMLRTESWVRTNDAAKLWVTPEQALYVVDDYWENIFEKYPHVLFEVERVLQKKIVSKHWTQDSVSKNKLKFYRVEEFNENHICKIIQKVNLNSILLDDHQLSRFYRYIFELKCMSQRYRDDFESYRQQIASSPIFPIAGEGFSYLKLETDSSRVFLINGTINVDTGVEVIINYRLLDTKYTHRISAQPGEDAQIKIIHERNDFLRKILTVYEIPELNEDTVLAELQLPFLQEQVQVTPVVIEQRNEVLFAIFKSYVHKEKGDVKFLQNLRKISDVYFQSAHGISALKEMLLPEDLQLNQEDKLYNPIGLSSLYIPQRFLRHTNVEGINRNEYLARFRTFLIDCGIKTSPNLFKRDIRFKNTADFQFKDEQRFNLWAEKINRDFRPTNMVAMDVVELDDATIRLLRTNNCDLKVMSNKIYQCWYEKHHKQSIDLESLSYTYPPTPGYFRVNYTKSTQRSVLVRDTMWAGLTRDQIPLQTIDKEVVSAGHAFWVDYKKAFHLKVARNFLKIVQRHEDPEYGYDGKYLSSLEIKEISLSALNALWDTVKENQYVQVAEAALEILHITGNDNGFLLYDKNQQRIRPVNQFRLGTKDDGDFPSIEVQYGETGRELGKKLGLIEKKDVDSYLDLIENLVFDERDTTVELIQSFILFLKNWDGLDYNSKGRICIGFEELMATYHCTQKPVIVFNDSEMGILLRKVKVPVLAIDLEQREIYAIESAIKDIGFDLFKDFGQVTPIGKENLSEVDKKEFQRLLAGYVNLLEPREQVNLEKALVGFGNKSQWHIKVFRVQSLHRVIDKENKVILPIELPYIDELRNELYVSVTEQPLRIIAHLLSLKNFTIFRSALKELAEIQKVAKVPSKNGTKMTIKDVAQTVVNNLVDDKPAAKHVEGVLEWKTGINSLQEEKLRNQAVTNIQEAFSKGPVFIEKNKRKSKKVHSDFKMIDESALDPKEFLLKEYEGRCQICGTTLTLNNGRKWVQIYRIQEKRDEHWWADQPYNILGLCPNCHVLAKHGGEVNFSQIVQSARLLIADELYPEEVERFQGDFYTVEVMLNGVKRELVISKTHLNYFCSLILLAEEQEETAVTDE